MLEIFIIGGRLGESIIIHTPGGDYGVVDAYASTWNDPRTNPTLTRLRQLGAKELRFVALTHPHMDHFRGLPSIFSAYSSRIKEFWRPPLGGQNLLPFLEVLFEEFAAEQDPVEQTQMAGGDYIFRELWSLAQKEKKAGTMSRQVLTNDGGILESGILLKEEAHDFSIWCLGPSSDIVEPYNISLATKNFERGLHEEAPTSQAAHNQISAVLAVKYGTWIGILGGDTEKASWTDILQRKSKRLEAARFFKISHHGSPTGSFEDLWTSIKSESCDTVVTCYQKHKLPKEKGLRYVRQRHFSLHSTNKPLAECLYKGNEPPPIPWELKFNQEPGEIRVAVDPTGQVGIEYFDPAGLVEL